LVTPVLALLLGNLINGESIGLRLLLGAGLIMLGLAVHQWESLLPMWRGARAAYR
jgi:drug/metabolite transporter (DMT)-like permease